jgi:hypothetical protein
MTHNKLTPIKKLKNIGCLNCSYSELQENVRIKRIRMDYRLENYPMGYDEITFNGKRVLCTSEISEEMAIPLMRFEKIARKAKGDWRLHIERALRSSIYQRQDRNKWVLVKCGEGYA